MAYESSQMLYKHEGYYKWTAKADHDNPYYKTGKDHSELNKTEGYEVLYFINHYADSRTWTNTLTNKQEPPSLHTYQKIERLIRQAPPRSTHKKVAEFITSNWNK